MSAVDLRSLQKRESVQDVPAEITTGAALFPLHFDAYLRNAPLPPFGTQARERALRQLDRDDYQLMWSGAVAGLVNRWASTPWEIKGAPEHTPHFQNVLRHPHLSSGWGDFIRKVGRDFLRHDRGAFIELIAAGPADGPPAGPVIGISHLDSLRCYPTGNPEYPVIYFSRYGSMHKLHHTRVFQLVDMPDGDDSYPGYGRCALSRAVQAVARERLLNRYIETYLDDKPAPGIVTVNGIEERQFKEAYDKFTRKMQSDDNSAWGRQMFLFSMLKGDVAPSIAQTIFSTAPEKFDFKTYIEIGVNQLALALGVDKLDLWEITSSGLGSGAQAEIMAAKAKGRTYGAFLTEFERFVNDILPDSCEFAFKQRDLDDSAAQADIANSYAQLVQVLGDTLTQQERRQLLANQVEAIADTITDSEGNVTRYNDTVDQPQTIVADDADAVEAPENAQGGTPAVQLDPTRLQQMSKAVDASGYFYLDLADEPQIRAIQQQFQSLMDAEGIEWQIPKTYHVTLVYANQITDVQMRRALASALMNERPLTLTCRAVDVFDGEQQALHLVVEKTQPLYSLQSRLYQELRAQGVEMSPYSVPENYKPHITLAYVPKGVQIPPALVSITLQTAKVVAGRGEYDPVMVASLASVIEEKSYSDTRAEFVRNFTDLVQSGLQNDLTRRRFGTVLRAQLFRLGRQAYEDGLRDGGVEDEIDDEDRGTIADWLASQSQYVTRFADQLFKQGLPESQVALRAEMWANKSLQGLYDLGRASADKNGLYQWSLGKTEEHCPTCLALNGQVHRLKEYTRRGLLPKSQALACGGWLCDCALRKTKGRARGRWPVVSKEHHHHEHEHVIARPQRLGLLRRMFGALKPGITVFKAEDGRRYMLIITANSYQDRERDIVTKAALTEYVESCWDGDVYKGDNVHLLWHRGDPIGDIVWADMHGKFLLELSKERPDAVVELGDGHRASIKQVWDAIEAAGDIEWGASHGFYVRPSERPTGVFRKIYKRETSTLPVKDAANLFTFSGVIT